MSHAWLNFSIVILVQFLLFSICAYHEKKISDIPRTLGWGVLIGIPMGLSFDFVLGKFFGLSSYTFGFTLPFLIINAALAYGIFSANILLLQYTRLPYFILWNIIVVAIYEIINHFFRVWIWEFALPPIEFMAVLLIGYLGGAIIVAVTSHVFLGQRFLFIDNLLKK